MPANPVAAFFRVLVDRRPYLGALYLLLAMPLGIAYFVFLTVGLSLGLGLAIVWIGVAILLAVLAGGLGLSAFERQQAIWLLGAEIGPVWRAPAGEPTFWRRLKALLANPVTWKGMLFLFLKFPLGIASFVVLVTTVAVSLGLMAAPFVYWYAPIEILMTEVDTLGEAIVVAVVGFLFFVVTLHALGGVAWVWRQLSVLLLGNRPLPQAPAV